MKQGWVYIMASQRNGTLYVGTTNDIARRVCEHKQSLVKGFTEKYKTSTLVYAENYPLMTEAIAREKQIKKWNRAWKIRLIESVNPEWEDLHAAM